MISEASRWLSQENSLFFLNAANILYVICYAVRDVLWLRIFCVTAMLTIMPYYVWGTEDTQMGCICWNIAFFAINFFWIVVIIRQRCPPKMTVQQRRLYSDVFERSCSPQDMLKLLSVATWVDVGIGETIVNKATDPGQLALLEHGNVNVILNDELVARLGRGDFVGEMSYLTGEPAVADVLASSPVKYIRWQKDELNKLLDGRSDLRSAITEIIGRDLIQKIGSPENKVPELSVETVIVDPT